MNVIVELDKRMKIVSRIKWSNIYTRGRVRVRILIKIF